MAPLDAVVCYWTISSCISIHHVTIVIVVVPHRTNSTAGVAIW